MELTKNGGSMIDSKTAQEYADTLTTAITGGSVKTYRLKATCDYIEEVIVKADSEEEAKELFMSGDYGLLEQNKLINETYENQEVLSIEEVRWKE